MSGCGDGRPTRVPVSGHVLIDGKPLTYGYVEFTIANSRPAMGNVDKDGHFFLTCFDPGDGAVIGKHRVAVVAREPINQETTKWHAPEKYADPASSGITQEITCPTDSVTINLTWDGKPGPFIEKH